MIDYTPSTNWVEPQIYDISDLVLGGNNGDSNIPLKALFDRTEYLYRTQGRIVVKTLTSNYTFQDGDTSNMFSFRISQNTKFTLPPLSSIPVGMVVYVTARTTTVKALTIICPDGPVIAAGAEDWDTVFMHDGESIKFIAASTLNEDYPDHWLIYDPVGNFFTAGRDLYARTLTKNAVYPLGQLVERADMPRLAKFAFALPSPGMVPEDRWQKVQLFQPSYKGFYSTGTTATNFRLPDERGLYTRNLDQGRGLSSSRVPDAAGGYEADAVASLSMTVEKMSRRGYPKQSGDRTGQNYYFIDGVQDDQWKPLTVTYEGATETRVKSLGKYLQILY